MSATASIPEHGRHLLKMRRLLRHLENTTASWARTIRVYRRPRSDRLPSSQDVQLAPDVLRWVNEYLAKPHPQLGRKGAICPFVRSAVASNRVFVAIHNEINGASRKRLRTVLMDRVDELIERYPETEPVYTW